MTPRNSAAIAKFQSIITTRSTNKEKHPGEKDQPKKRRTAQEMEEARAQAALKEQRVAEQQQARVDKVAQIEDDLRNEDIAKRASGHHRNVVAPFRPPVAANDEGSSSSLEQSKETAVAVHNLALAVHRPAGSKLASGDEDEDSASGSDTNYKPGACEETDGESEVEDEDSAEDEPAPNKVKSKKGKAKPGRRDINAARKTHAAKGTPSSVPSLDTKRKAKDDVKSNKAAKKLKNAHKPPSGLLSGWDGAKKSLSGPLAATTTDDDDSMVCYGGMVDDEERDDVERQVAVSGNAKRFLPTMIKISASKPAAAPLTKKNLRGGATKWKLEHLPDGTQRMFSDSVVPLAKIVAGTLPPWTDLTTDDIQKIVDKVFGQDSYTVEGDDAWCGLVSYRINNWRNVFGSAAATAVKTYIAENELMFENGEQDIAEFVELYTEASGDPLTAPFHWHEWNVDMENDGKVSKKGRFQNALIVYTLAHAHFSEFDDVPNAEDLDSSEMPSGALILALQVVHHAFKSWKTGGFIKDSSPKGFFSADNYADYTEQKANGKDGRMKNVHIHRATQYLPTVKSLSQEHWIKIFNAARSVLQDSGKKRKRSKSVSSRASSDVFEESEDHTSEYILLSDDD